MDNPPQGPGPVVEMESCRSDDGEIIYTSKKQPAPWRAGLSAWVVRLAGIALGVGLFLLMIFLCVYVIVPLIVIFAIYLFVRGLFTRR